MHWPQNSMCPVLQSTTCKQITVYNFETVFYHLNVDRQQIQHAELYALSNFKFRCDVTRGWLRISGELPLSAHVVYGIVAKHVHWMWFFWTTQSIACDKVTSRLISKLDGEYLRYVVLFHQVKIVINPNNAILFQFQNSILPTVLQWLLHVATKDDI